MLNKKMKRLPFILLTLLIVAACDTGGAFSIPNASSSGSLVSSELLSEATNEEEIGTEGLLFTLTIYEGKQSYVVSGYEGKSKDVIIPSTFNNIDVVGVGTIAFASKGIETVVFSDNIKFIGAYAFQQNQLTSVTIPDNFTTISNNAFSENRLTSVTIPNNVTTIGNFAFSNNQITSLTIPNNVTTIGTHAFASNQITSLTIPNIVTTIGDFAFASNLFTTLIIPNNVTTIGEGAFSSSLEKTIYVEAAVKPTGWNQSWNYSPKPITIIWDYKNQ